MLAQAVLRTTQSVTVPNVLSAEVGARGTLLEVAGKTAGGSGSASTTSVGATAGLFSWESNRSGCWRVAVAHQSLCGCGGAALRGRSATPAQQPQGICAYSRARHAGTSDPARAGWAESVVCGYHHHHHGHPRPLEKNRAPRGCGSGLSAPAYDGLRRAEVSAGAASAPSLLARGERRRRGCGGGHCEEVDATVMIGEESRRDVRGERAWRRAINKRGGGCRAHSEGGNGGGGHEEGGEVVVKLRLDHQVQYGEKHAVLGSTEWLGKWKKPVEMVWSESGWVAQFRLPRHEHADKVEFKFVILKGDGTVEWEAGENRSLKIPRGQMGGGRVVCEYVTQWAKPGRIVSSSAEGSDRKWDHHHGQSGQIAEQQQKQDARVEREEGREGAVEWNSNFVQEWQGKDPAFMRSNAHARERKGMWNTEGLDGAAREIVEADRSAGNWWRKLEVVLNVLSGEDTEKDRMDALVNIAMYLQWINTGAIACVEDGGHRRPNRHAELSRQIFRKLESYIGQKGVTPQELTVIRRVQPRLPAFTADFTASVPLTRIRDIAHRNDIPHDLKQEIKHTIQNKLHRNAGPEDLVATEALLNRVLAKKNEYSSAFVEQLQIFYGELKEFFNANSLAERLESIRPSMDPEDLAVLDLFLSRKKRLDDAESLPASRDANQRGGILEILMSTMHVLTGLRAVLLKGLESGLRNDAPDEAVAMRQKWRLSEIGLEDYAFVLLSRFLNALNDAGGAALLAEGVRQGSVGNYNHPLGATILGIRQLGLSGWRQAECIAIENELSAWQAAGIIEKDGKEEDTRMWALRLKATLERAKRLAESYSDSILEIYPKRCEALGKALGIPENSIRTFAEAEIRSSVVFQLSKLCSLSLKSVRLATNGDGWDVLMPGSAVGTLVEVDQMTPESMPSPSMGPVILLSRFANGDEEVKAAGAHVVGVVLCHELPHLSHLGVRARQERVTFVTCEDEERVADIRALCGRPVRLEASANGVRITAHSGSIPEASSNDEAVAAVSTAGVPSKTSSGNGHMDHGAEHESAVQIFYPNGHLLLDVKDASPETAGAKAAACGRLAQLAASSAKVLNERGVPAMFRVPKSVAIPFGVMEAAVKDAGESERFASLLEAIEVAPLAGGVLDGACAELRELVGALRPPASLVKLVEDAFQPDARLIARSSANVEDLKGMSGAGLYDSVPNVKLHKAPNAAGVDFGEAVAQVWSSLYTRRAVLSRRMAGVPQREAVMGVLVQELLTPSLSFVLHTRSPIDGNEDMVHAELALGLGETLASGTRGTPWRLAVNKLTGQVRTLAFANFSESLVVRGNGKSEGRMVREVADYSGALLSKDSEARTSLGQRLATVGSFLEQMLGGAQDIEGAVVERDIFIVQSRPQP
ncbi:hypothetical protein CBR_g30239 [Chara braunii]|uniref:CBM20 domain-containing protein n=1 Tax=Chara braunii TaxID=69332 RepID=A0A388LCC4_CHABU|nr:hypothetical protein CBR_g30239 [Chara braunii]|eukprot:GBG79977.1 hypothetical protein CBR_g30239 [Chara braunii]